jgi:anti-anti-sigma factor
MQRRPGAVVLTVRGEIDSANVHILEDTINHALSDGLPLITDLREVSYIDGSGLHMLVRAYERRTSHETRLPLVCTSEIITRLVSILSLGDMFQTFPDVDAALAHLSNGSTS